jgi:nucleoside-diphosphate-sugar epimerase
MEALIIGGTRNLGPSLATALLESGYSVTVFNRGITPGQLPQGVERLYGDRSDPKQLASALGRRNFDLAIDTTLYTGPDAEAVVSILADRVGRYVFLSTGQVYLVRVGLERPYRESDDAGPVMPDPGGADHEDWVYGVDKRAAEDILRRAWEQQRFPFTTLRLPMVNSELDHHNRIYGYWLRLRDGGPILIPAGPALPLRHVYGGDVVRAVLLLASKTVGLGQAYNISQDETLDLDDFLARLAGLAGKPLRTVKVPREKLGSLNLLPACSPFSGTWMSVLDNAHSKAELGMTYTGVPESLERLVSYFSTQQLREIPGYRQRPIELDVISSPPTPPSRNRRL